LPKASKFADCVSDLIFLFEVLPDFVDEGFKGWEFDSIIVGVGCDELFSPFSCFSLVHEGKDEANLAFVIIVDLFVDLKIEDASLEEPSYFGSISFEGYRSVDVLFLCSIGVGPHRCVCH